MEARDKEDSKKDEEMKEMSKDEREYHNSIRDYLSHPEDTILGGEPIKYTLDNVDRFSMVKSRIP